MKLIVHESEGAFEFSIEPETIADCAMLARISMNATKNVREIGVHAWSDHTMTGFVVIGKRKQPDSRL